ncbi:amylo-alpha-1,6-glucosidase [Flavobacterium sp. TMP13]|uniref:amylo-alpha-1,6-glucosidase n=1 Tax=Flavobacterium sp. TMP13 TaxID=3425950 RepID=UPI003D782029
MKFSNMVEDAMQKEWIITNGLGGYASGTVAGSNSRCYHGLLIAALEPPTNRKTFLAKIEERVLINEMYHDLSCNQYKETIYPKGLDYLKNFEPKPFPKWNYQGENWKVVKNVLMPQKENTTLIYYKNVGDQTIDLELHPLYSFADFHTTFQENTETDFYSEFSENSFKTYAKYGAQPFFTAWSKGIFTENRSWYKDIQLAVEKERGLPDSTDYYRIGYVTCRLKPDEEIILSFSVDEITKSVAISQKYKKTITASEDFYSPKNEGFYTDLLASGKQFLVYRQSTQSDSIIAGYHWFSDWGRDTMIAMRGLTISVGDQKASKSILKTFLEYVDQGMLPNRFQDNASDQVEYNTIDATLWLFVALYEYHQRFADTEFMEQNSSILQSILQAHLDGTRYNIHVTEQGFLYGGQAGVQLTWMDAIVDGTVITPRIGCPVEINMLWYNALQIYKLFCKKLNHELNHEFLEVISSFEVNFSKYFINSEGTLYDVIVPNTSADTSFRSNQIYALSLPFTVLNQAQQKIIFEALKYKLWTPFGLRTLAEDDAQFIAVYEGNQWNRDHAYHQGTVWPFLLGEYYQAFFKLYGNSEENRKRVVDELKELRAHFYVENGLHCISEIFDGALPLDGKGCIQQAWSVAAILKLYADFELHTIDSNSI